jgi:hypothetical protein
MNVRRGTEKKDILIIELNLKILKIIVKKNP